MIFFSLYFYVIPTIVIFLLIIFLVESSTYEVNQTNIHLLVITFGAPAQS